MAHSGRLIIGVNISMPIGPRLVTVNVPPCISAAESCAAAGTIDQVARSGGKLAERQRRHIADHRDQQARVGVDGDTDVDTRRDDDLVAAPAGVQERMFLECQGGQLDDEVGESDRTSLACAGHGLELLPQVDQIRGVDGRR